MSNGDHIPRNEASPFPSSSYIAVSNSPASATHAKAQCNNSNTDPAILSYQMHNRANAEEGSLARDVNSAHVGGSYLPSSYYQENKQQIPVRASSSGDLLDLSNSHAQPDMLLHLGGSRYDHSILDLGLKDVPLQHMIQTILEDMKKEKSESSSAIAPQYTSQVQQQRTGYPTMPPCQKIQVPEQLIRSQGSAMSRMVSRKCTRRNCMGNGVLGGECYRVLLRHMECIRHRPPDNNISYWKGFVANFYESNAKKTICFSKCPSAGTGAHLASFFKEVPCLLCRSQPGVGFDITSEFLHWTFKSNFDSGVIDKLLYLDSPVEWKLPSGFTLLRCNWAVMQSIYSTCHVVHEGPLSVLFSRRSKIVSWEFCVRRLEVFLSQKSVAPQVHELINLAQKYQNSIEGSRIGKGLEQEFLGITKARYQLLQAIEQFDVNGVVPHEWLFINGSQGDNSPHESCAVYPSEK
ncbi:putative transcriptional regulator SLK1 [Drosera capensis]